MTSKVAAAEMHETENGRVSVCGSTVKLKRELGLFSAINLILGVMIGSGIFIAPATALKHSGSVGMCLIIWTISGVISFLGALSFAELGTVLGKSGAEYSYFQEAFSKMHKFWGPLPSFICAWMYVMILRPVEVAVIVMTFAEYAIQPFTPNLDPEYKDTVMKLGSLSALYSTISPNNVVEKSLSYVEGLRTDIVNSNTPIVTNSNLITSQFLSEMKQKTDQVDELIAFTRGSVCDINNEIERLNALIKTAKEALSKPKVQKQEVSPEQLREAKETFQILKSELHGLIQSIFPNTSDLVTDILGQLMQENLSDGSSGYIQITQETYCIIELLKDMNIVSTNPYNNTEVKLAL